ncbi:MAG TPA: SDR family oxidoreductase [Kineosporiaceae bacterium]
MNSEGVAGLGVVVTGAASGIGAALARRLAVEGARVVVNDRAAEGAQRVAAEVGGLAVPGDAASVDGVVHLVAAARHHLGEIDIFFANAGVGGDLGLDCPEDAWESAWQVNVMAHVRAARALVPAWVARGRGHFVATVSAAGLLTMPGAAPYAVTKHGALAFAEWLAISYADRGVTVQAVCPLGVRTPMLAAAGAYGEAVLGRDAISAEQVAHRVVESLAGGPFLILPHPQVARFYADRAADPDGWQAATRRLLANLPTPP